MGERTDGSTDAGSDRDEDHRVSDERDGAGVDVWRRLGAGLRRNWSRILVDLAVVVTWLVLATAVFRLLALPQWLLYVVVFVGVVLYSHVTPAWQRSAGRPDT